MMVTFPKAGLCADYRVLVVAGQSNAVGNGVRPTDLDARPALKTQPDIPFRYWLRNATPTAAAFTSNNSTVLGIQYVTSTNPPFPWSVNGTYGGFGPEIRVGRDIKDATGWNVMVVKVAAGGTAMGNSADAAGQDLWKVGGNLHARLVTEIQGAINQLTAQGHTAQVAGFFWHQGESDARKDAGADRTENAMAYEKNLAELVGNLRQTFSAPQMPAVFARVDPEDIPAWGQYYRTNADVVRGAIMNYAANDPLAEWVNVDDLPRRKDLDSASPDILHLTYLGQLAVGERMAAAYLRLLEPAAGAPAGQDHTAMREQKAGLPDFDRDGRADLLEAALGSNRTVADTTSPISQIGVPSPGILEPRYERAGDISRFRPEVEVSSDLATWTTDGVNQEAAIVDAPGGRKLVTARAAYSGLRQFARIRARELVRNESLGPQEVADVFRRAVAWWSGYLNASGTGDTYPGTGNTFEWATRMLVPMAAWLSQPGRSTTVTWNGVTVNVAETLRKALVNGTDPANPDRWPTASASGDQIVVEAPQVAYATWLLHQAKLSGAPGGAVWDAITPAQRANINSFLANTARDTYTTYPHNWNMFIVISHEVRKRLEAAGVAEFSGWSQSAIDTCRRNLQARHQGGGWYSDNALRNVYDDYISWAILPDQMVAFMIGAADTQAQTLVPGLENRGRSQILGEAGSWLAGHPLFFDALGRSPEYGRSTTYKFGRLRALTTALQVDRFYAGSWGIAPVLGDVPAGMLRRLVRLHLDHYLANGMFDPTTGELRNGQTIESAAGTMEPYISDGSRFWAFMAFVPLLQLPDSDPLWSAPEQALDAEESAYYAWMQTPGQLARNVPEDNHLELFNGRGQRGSWTDATYVPRYGKYVYSSQLGHCLSAGSPYDQSISIGSYRRDNPSSASYYLPSGLAAGEPGVLRTTHVQGDSASQQHYTVRTLIFFKGPAHVRVSRVVGASGQAVCEGGYALGHSAGETPPAAQTGSDWIYLESSAGAAFTARLLGYTSMQQASGSGNHTRSANWRVAYAQGTAGTSFDCAVLVRGSANRFDPAATRAIVQSVNIEGETVTIEWGDGSSTFAPFE